MNRFFLNLSAYKWGLFLIAVTAACIYRFYSLMPTVYSGDDLTYYYSFLNHVPGTRLHDVLTSCYMGKFRPVSSGILAILFGVLEDKIYIFLLLNVLLMTATCFVAVKVVKLIYEAPYLLLLALGVIISSSRFALFQVTQVVPNEQLAFFLFICTIYFQIRRKHSNNSPTLLALWTLIFATLSNLCHERYILVYLWLIIDSGILTIHRKSNKYSYGIYSSLAIIIPLAYVVYKEKMLNTSILVGVGGARISPTLFDFIKHCTEFLASLFGFNLGPDHLVGINFFQLPSTLEFYLSIFIFISLLFLLYKSLVFTRGFANFFCSNREIISYLLLFIFISLPAVSTIRVEQRWIYTSYVLILLFIPYLLLSRSKKNQIITYTAILLVYASLLYIDTTYLTYYNRTYLVDSYKVASDFKDNHAPALLRAENVKNIAIIGQKTNSNWIFSGNDLFKLLGLPFLSVVHVDNTEEVPTNFTTQNSRFYKLKMNYLEDVTSSWSKPTAENQPISYNFINSFDHGILSNTSPVSTPTGKGVFLMNLDCARGKTKSMVLVEGHEIVFPNVLLPKNSDILFSASMVYPGSVPSSLQISLIDPTTANKSVIFDADLIPPQQQDDLNFQHFQLHINNQEAETKSIAFRCYYKKPPNGPLWIGISDAKISSQQF